MTAIFVGPLPIVLCQTIFPPDAPWIRRTISLAAHAKLYRRIADEPIHYVERAGGSARPPIQSSAPLKNAPDEGRLLLVGRVEHLPAGRHAVDCCDSADIGHELQHDFDEL